MALEYDYDSFWGFEELKAAKPKIAEILTAKFDAGDWQKQEIHVYADVKVFGMSELMNGIYQSLTYSANHHLKNSNVPNFLEYINFKKLGEDLVESYGEKYVFVTKSGIVVQTHVGFW